MRGKGGCGGKGEVGSGWIVWGSGTVVSSERQRCFRHTGFVANKVVVREERDHNRAPKSAVDNPHEKRKRLAHEVAKIRPEEEKRLAEEGLVDIVG
jgi:hypothetical protein